MCLVAHPVGSIYETTDVSFNPNVEWGGTWELMDDGRFLLSSSEQYAVNAVGGEEEHTLSVPEIPNHRHLHSHPHSHSRGTLEHHITGYFGGGEANGSYQAGGAFYYEGSGYAGVDGSDTDNARTMFDSTRDGASYWEGHTSQDDTEGGSYVGGGEPHNNMPPYYVVHRWHRIA